MVQWFYTPANMKPGRPPLAHVLAFASIFVLTAAMVGMHVLGSPESHESATLLLVLNIAFTTLLSGYIAVLAGRSFLTSGQVSLLAICTGMIIWGISAFVAVIDKHVGNFNITVHNLGVALSGACHLGGAIAVSRRRERSVRVPGDWLSAAVAASFIAVGAIWMTAQEGRFPPFFIEGIGATALRTSVLVASIAMFTVAAVLTWLRYNRSGSRFLFWYALSLALVAAGALGLILQPTHGSWLGWVARGTQYLAGIYMMFGTIASLREQGNLDLSLEERLIRSELARREQADLIRTVNDNTNELIFMKDTSGRLTYANAATLRLIGRASVDRQTPERELIRVPVEHAVISANDRLVMQTGQVVEAEEVYTGADGVQRTYLSTKSPLRDRNGQIIGVIGVSRDISERLVARERLQTALKSAESASAALREADLRKDEFLAMLAHELRGPLAPLRNMVEILKRKTGNVDVVRSAAGMMERQLGQLVRLVDDLIDVSRITRGQIELRKETVDLSSIIRQSVEACRPLAEASNHELEVSLWPRPIRLHGDPVRLTQVFSNILNNACKYTKPGGQIRISSEARDSEVVVTVKDSGIGIAPDQLDVVFDLFAQIDRTLERTQSGLGIGLTLVKRLAELHGGTVRAQSQGLGMGTEIIVHLPTIEAAQESPAARPGAVDEAGARQRFLVVDDNEDSASSLAMLLSIDGHEVQVAHDGIAAVEAAERFGPDVVLLDIGLPRLNGYEACRRIRSQGSGSSIAIIALTGWGQEEDRRKSREAGFDHHLIKPIDYDALKDWLAQQERAPRTA